MTQIVVTHDSFFHADDVFACALLEARFGEIHLIRTRNTSILNRAVMDPSVMVVDVGGFHDPVLNNYDHHQSDFDCIYDSGTLKASAGLVWDQFGRDVLKKFGVVDDVEAVFEEVGRRLFEPLDAFDNGQIHYRATNRESGESLAPLPATAVFASFNARERPTDSVQMEGFVEAMKVARRLIISTVERTAKLRKAKRLVRAAFAASLDPVQYFEENLPWAEAAQDEPELMYVVFPNVSNGSYSAIAVAGAHSPKSPFPQEWRGLVGPELVEASGVAGLTFCHKGGFMVSSSDKDSAIAAARLSLSMSGIPF